MKRTLGEKLVAEFVGALALIFIGAGSIIAAGTLAGAGGAGLVTIGLAHGLAIATMVSAVGHVSGGHFNPAVSISAMVTGKMSPTEGIPYVVAQLAGGAAGAGLLRAALPRQTWEQVSLGTPLVADGISNGQAVLIEAVLTFFLVWVIFATAIDSDGSFNKIAGLAIGFVITMDIMMGGPFTGASMNPARTFGPALAGGFWEGHWVYWAGPVLGGVAAASLYDVVVLRPRRGRTATRVD